MRLLPNNVLVLEIAHKQEVRQVCWLNKLKLI